MHKLASKMLVKWPHCHRADVLNHNHKNKRLELKAWMRSVDRGTCVGLERFISNDNPVMVQET
jgi:hypothetical protein